MSLTTNIGTAYKEKVQSEFTMGDATVATSSDTFELGNTQGANSLSFVFLSTTIAETTGTVTIQLQESADDSSWTSITGAEYVVPATGVLTKDAEIVEITVPADVKRYIKAVVTASNANEEGSELDIFCNYYAR